MFDSIVSCRRCKKEKIVGFNPYWGHRNLCGDCREAIYSKHKSWMDKLLIEARANGKQVF